MPMVEISNGEVLDKASILTIKFERIHDPAKRPHIIAEMDALKDLVFSLTREDPGAYALYQQLVSVNLALWEIEDELRNCERDGAFDNAFVHLARQVYKINDRRAAIKAEINEYTQSGLVEVKSYAKYLEDEDA